MENARKQGWLVLLYRNLSDYGTLPLKFILNSQNADYNGFGGEVMPQSGNVI